MSIRYHSRYVTAQDGLKLHLRVYGPRVSRHRAVVCLAGLARTSADFDGLATALALDHERPRRVIALDARGRGDSDYDRSAANYSFAVELADVLAVTTALDIGPAVFVGSSRGGILIMLLAAARPTMISGAVLNDIGPVIEGRGLARIKSYLGKLPPLRSFEEGADTLRRLFGAQFPKLSAEDWLAFSHRSFRAKDGTLAPNYDVRLARTLRGLRIERLLPPLWKEFGALADVPLMVIRGANSDMLSPATLAAMRERRPDIQVAEVPDQGHVPLLAEDDIIRRIGAFAAACDR